jgi:hypothetical protein
LSLRNAREAFRASVDEGITEVFRDVSNIHCQMSVWVLPSCWEG